MNNTIDFKTAKTMHQILKVYNGSSRSRSLPIKQ